jgi:hypothetical protein
MVIIKTNATDRSPAKLRSDMTFLPRCFQHSDREHDINASGTSAASRLYWSVERLGAAPFGAMPSALGFRPDVDVIPRAANGCKFGEAARASARSDSKRAIAK